MKLPEDRKERIKIYVLLGIGAVIVLYATVFGLLRPVLSSRKAKLAAIEELTAKLEASQARIDQMNQSRARNIETMRKIVELTNDRKYVLEPRLGNYLLSAREMVEQHAAAMDMAVEVREIGLSQLPQASGKSESRDLNVYTAAVNAECGLHELVQLLQRLESANPLLCVSAINISGQSKNPGAHLANFQIQWPVWADPDRKEAIMTNLHEITTPHGPGSASDKDATVAGGEKQDL